MLQIWRKKPNNQCGKFSVILWNNIINSLEKRKFEYYRPNWSIQILMNAQTHQRETDVNEKQLYNLI